MKSAADPISRRRVLARTAVWTAAFVGFAGAMSAGCKRPEGPLIKAGMYGDTPEELQRLWVDILTACQTDDRSQVHDLLASLIMTPAELTSLIGPAKAAELGSRYKAMMASLCNAGAVELVGAVYEKKYDDVVVSRTAPPGLTPTDQEVLKALVVPTPLYTVRVKKKTEASGLRYDFFVYRNGFWRSGNQLGKYLGPPPPLPGALPKRP